MGWGDGPAEVPPGDPFLEEDFALMVLVHPFSPGVVGRELFQGDIIQFIKLRMTRSFIGFIDQAVVEDGVDFGLLEG